MLQNFLAVTAVVGLIFIRGGHCQCYTDPGCGGDTIDVTEAGSPIADQADCCVGTNAGLSYNDGSSCNLCIVHGFAQAAYDVVEDERLDTMFQRNVKGMTQFSGLVVAGVITATADGTAVDSDFQQLTLIQVTNNAEIRLFAANDEIALEYDDRVLLAFFPDNPALITGLLASGEYVRDSATVNIIDNDLLEINFLESDYSGVEGSAELSSPIMIQLRQNQNPFTLMLSPVSIDTAESKGLGFFINSQTIPPGSRATADDDFSDSAITITVPANSNPSYRIDQFFTINEDDIDEDEQSFAIVAEIGSDVPENISCFQLGIGATECFGRRGATEIRITDNDPMIIGFTQRIRTVSEGQVSGVDLFQLEINVESVRTAEREHPMQFRLQEASTNATVEPLIASSPAFDATFGLRANLDDPIEENRDLDPGTRVVTPSLLTAIRNDLIPEDLECYTTRIFPVDVPGRRELFECNEDTAMADNYLCEHTICIEDNDDPFEVAFVRTMYTVDESAGPVLICVNLTRPEFDILDETVNVFVTDFPTSMYIPVGDVPFATPDIPDFLSRYPMAERSDFQQQTALVNLIDDVLISELMRIVCYNQTIYDDLRLEANEYAGLMLEVRDNLQTTVLTLEKDLFNESSILIVDNDRAVVGLEMTFFSVSEGVGYVELCANVSFPEITCPIEFPFEVGLSTADGTAVETMDYGAIDVILMFDTCETRKCVNVTIAEDLVDEQQEFFTYTLTGTPSLDPRIELNPTDGRVEIIDNDVNITVGYNPISYVASEGQGSVELTIVIFDPPVGGAPRPFTLVINTQDGTAIAGAPDNDYNAVIGEIVQFNVGNTFQTHRIIINDDMMCENDPNEFFFSNIALDSGVQPIFVIQPQATVTINDDAQPECLPIEVGYEFSVYTTTEGIGVVTLCAVTNFPGGSPRPFTLLATTEDGSAVSGDDYVGVVDVPLMFQVGDDRVCHDVVIIDDDDCETPFEDFFSNLEYDSGDMPITITRERTRVIINDIAEPECDAVAVIGLERTLYSIQEGSAPAVEVCIVVYRPTGICPIPFPFSVMFSTSDLTAVVDNDYLDADTIQIFGACATRRCIFVPIVDDSTEEPDESVSISLGDPSDSRITASPRQGLINITDTTPSGSPEMFGAVAGEREVEFSWSPPPPTQQNGVITSYTLSCSPSPSSLPQSPSSQSSGSLSVTGFSPNTLYSCSLTANNSQGSGPPATAIFTTQQDYAYFQLRLKGVLPCPNVIATLTEQKLKDVETKIIQIFKAGCAECSSNVLDEQSFSCFEESPLFLTYRARLEGTSETDSGSLVSLIEAWVRGGGASVIVTGILMTVDSQCSVTISSLSDPECSKPSPPPNEPKPSLTQTLPTAGSDSTAAIIGGVVAIVLIIAIVVTIVVIAALILKNRRLTTKTAEKFEMGPVPGSPGVIPTSTNSAYHTVKEGRVTGTYDIPLRAGDEGGYDIICPSPPPPPPPPSRPSPPPRPRPPSQQSLPKLPESEEEVYEVIPGEDN